MKIQQFKVGDRVRHLYTTLTGNGTVEYQKGREVYVFWDNWEKDLPVQSLAESLVLITPLEEVL